MDSQGLGENDPAVGEFRNYLRENILVASGCINRELESRPFFFEVGKLQGYCAEGFLEFEKRIDHIRIEVLPFVFYDNADRLVVGIRGFVDTLADQGIIHIRQGHQASGNRDIIPGQPLGIPCSIPSFVMRVGNLLGEF